jgi:type II secretory pathway component GspD/PulD (secretin)
MAVLKRFLAGCLLTLLASLAWSQPMKSIEFRDQSIRDILLTLGELNDVSIVPDETVDGKASYVFANMDFQQALQLFLDTFRLSSTLKSNVYSISRVQVIVNPDGTLDVRAGDVPLKSILRVISNQIGKTILYDNLPNDPFTLNVQNAKIEEILKIAIARYPDFSLEIQDKYFYLKNKAQSASASAPTSADAIAQNGDSFDLKITHGRFKDLLLSLFSMGKNEFVLLLDRDVIIDNLFLKGLSFDEALKALLLQVNADFKIDKGVYYIYEVQRKDLLKKYLTNIIIPFQYISSADFLKLLPPNLNSGSFFRLDEKGNKIVLSGSLEEIKPIWDFVKLIDQANPGNTTLRVDLKYVKTDDVIPLLPPDLVGFAPLPLPSKTSLLVNLPETKKQAFLDFIQLVDQPIPDTPIHLRYMKADDLIAKLPPTVTADNIIKTNDQTLVFFKGSQAVLQLFKKDLEQLDVPKPLLRYEILVLQFEEGTTLSYQPNLATQTGLPGTSFTGQFSPALNMNFDVIGDFGAGFVASLSAAITENNAKVVADTTLNGLSGEKVSFQNTTSTYYAANEISTTGTATVVGSVNQLSTGLILNLQGWISSDNMVTLQVDTTLSNQSASNSSSTSGTSTSSSSTSGTGTSSTSTTLPPNTTEKKLSTQVRMLSGQPLVIGGLKEDDKTTVVNKTPILGDIPGLGLLFKGISDTVDHTEFTIYIVPILDKPDEHMMSEEDRMLMYYHRFQKDNG